MRGASTLNPIAPREGGRKTAPRLVLALTGELGTAVESHFRGLGWDVATAATGEEARELAARNRATAVVLSADADAESGTLTCAKLSLARPQVRVVLVGPESR